MEGIVCNPWYLAFHVISHHQPSVEGGKVLVLGDGWRKRRSKTWVGLAPTGYYSSSVRLNIK